MAKKSEVQVTGGMKPGWISSIARGKWVTETVRGDVERVRRRLNSKAEARQPLAGQRKGKNHYGYYQKKGKWGSTFIMWPITEVAKKNVKWFRSAISSVRSIKLKEKK